jgi:hypothetical protein
MSTRFGASGAVLAVVILTLIFIAYQAVALIRLSCWPVLLTIASLAWTLIDRRA